MEGDIVQGQSKARVGPFGIQDSNFGNASSAVRARTTLPWCVDSLAFVAARDVAVAPVIAVVVAVEGHQS